MKKLIIISVLLLSAVTGYLVPTRVINQKNENDYNRAFCDSICGQTEVRHYYNYPGGRSYVIVDCETDTHVYEGGLDKRSSLDSVQQALFFSHVTGKEPVVVIYDTDNKVGQFEHRIKMATELARVEFRQK